VNVDFGHCPLCRRCGGAGLVGIAYCGRTILARRIGRPDSPTKWHVDEFYQAAVGREYT